MPENKFSISKSGRPDQEVPDAEKSKIDYGKRCSGFILSEWMRRDTGAARLYTHKLKYEENRAYAVGRQSTERYKERFNIDGNLAYLNLDWSVIPVVPKYVDIIVNSIQDRIFNIKASSQDKVSITNKKNKLAILKAEMSKKEELMKIQEATGVNVFENDPNTLPKNNEELEVYVNINMKEGVEIAAETAVSAIFDQNKYNELVKKRVNRDITEIGIGCVKHGFSKSEGITIDYVDPVDLVYSYTKTPSFDDCYYFGEVKQMTLSEIRTMFPDLEAEELDKIRQAGGAFSNYTGLEYEQFEAEYENDPNLIQVLFFSWKTTRKVVHKIRDNKKGGKTAILKDESFNPPKDERTGFERTYRVEEVVYEGVQILGNNDLLLKWELQENMVRPKSSSRKVIMPYIAYAPKMWEGIIESTVSKITSHADQVQLNYIKLQQIIQKMNPAGVWLDADGLAEIDLGNGTSYNAKEALDLFFQTGSVIGRSKTIDGEQNAGRVPIQELDGSSGQQIDRIIGAINWYLSQIESITGINSARAAGNPDQYAAVGVQELAVANSEVATRHILTAGVNITERLAEAVVLRLSDALEYWPMKEDLINRIGRANTAIIEELKDLHLHDYGIVLELGPSAEEDSFLESNIQVALSKDSIHLEDAIYIRSIKNTKLATQILKVKRKEKADMDLEIDKQKQQYATEAATASAEAASKAKASEYAAEYAEKIKYEIQLSELTFKKLDYETQKQIQLMNHEHKLGTENKGMDAAIKEDQMNMQGQQDISKEREKKKFESSGYDSKPNGTALDKTFKIT